MEIGSVIREKRTAQGLTQEQVATALGVSAPAVSKWERGESFPEITLLPALARLLGTDLNGLLSFQQEMGDGLTLETLLSTESPEDSLIEQLSLRAAIDLLPERERMTILLRFFKALTQEQTARVLGVSQVQVSRLERRALQKLRTAMETEG